VKPAVLRRAAYGDVERQVRWYRQNATESTAVRFRDALRTALDRIEERPGVGSPRFEQELGLEGLRSWSLDTFPVTIFYFERDDALDVWRLLRQSQDIQLILSSNPAP
jgi:toxin ParE1/3/4